MGGPEEWHYGAYVPQNIEIVVLDIPFGDLRDVIFDHGPKELKRFVRIGQHDVFNNPEYSC
jgi:hypothetical protein